MKRLYSLLAFVLFLSLPSMAEVVFEAQQSRDGNEIVLQVSAKVVNGPQVALGGTDIPFRVLPGVLDLGGAYIDMSQPRSFDVSSDPSSYIAMSLHANNLLVLRINENNNGNGSGVFVETVAKPIGTVRIPILNSCSESHIEWDTKWGQVTEYEISPWPKSIKSEVSFMMSNPSLPLFEAPAKPSLIYDGPVKICAGTTVTLATKNPKNHEVIWEKDGVVLFSGSDSTFSVNATGSYRVGLRNCSVEKFSDPVVINVVQQPEKPFITENQGTLTSSSEEGNQWYLNGNVLTGSTEQTLVPTQSGSYTVEVSNTCGKSVSDPFTYTANTLGQGVIASRVGVYPNPYFGNANIYLDLVKESDVLIEVYDLKGIKVQEIEDQHLFSGAYEWRFETVDLGLPSGAYIIKLFADGRVYTTTLIEASK